MTFKKDLFAVDFGKDPYEDDDEDDEVGRKNGEMTSQHEVVVDVDNKKLGCFSKKKKSVNFEWMVDWNGLKSIFQYR